MTSVLVVLITCPDHASADRLAVELVEQRHAACVNLIPGLTSVYRWAGKIEKDHEVLLVAKTTDAAFVGLKKSVTMLHPAELPEIIALPVSDGLTGYLQWVNAETTQQ
ncbi:MAG: divalent-cation tolerance protein CutA [Gammaproteobacteria bacterium]|nr:divalent-cation tolerance protein CutA [Gammaproteobacteria bacterium]